MISHEQRTQSIKLIVGVGGGLSAVSGAVSDFVYPVAPFGLYIAIILVIVLILSFACYCIPSINNRISPAFGFYWYAPTAITMFVAIVVMSTAYALSKNSGSDGQGNGFAADHFSEIAQLQATLLDIKTDIHDIRETSARTATATERAADAAVITASTVNELKKEVSSDPRKELANLGISWSIGELDGAVEKGDNKAILLFLSGGMRFNSNIFKMFVTKHFSNELSKQLLESNYLNGIDLCPTETRELDFYKEIIDKDALFFVKKICSIPEVINKIAANRDKLIIKIEEQKGSPEKITKCIQVFKQLPKSELEEKFKDTLEVTRFYLFDAESYLKARQLELFDQKLSEVLDVVSSNECKQKFKIYDYAYTMEVIQFALDLLS